jgi:hypothetical protein
MRLPALHVIRFLPVVFVTGIDGFAMFAPYIVGLLGVTYVIKRLRSEPQPVPATA